MPRTKPKTDPTLKSWEDVDTALLKIQEAEDIITQHELVMNTLIAKAKADSEAAARPRQAEIKALGLQIKEYVTAHRDELDGKTKKLNFGSTGFRLSTKLVVPKAKEADVLATLKKLGLKDCIKVVESIRKDVLKQQPEAVVIKTGAYLKPADEFWYETEREELLDPGA